ncbi:retrotransposon 1, partial [Podarcis lilfordi]
MPFGLCNVPTVFQRYINHVFQEWLDKYVVVYLDDILIYSRDLARQEGHVWTVLQRLREHRLYSKPSKCKFHQRSVDFLGHRLSPDGVQMDPGKVAAVREWAAPRNRKDLQRFLGFANYYRTFIADYALCTTPLTRLLHPKTPFSWDKEADEAFQGLKACFQRAPILQHPDPSRPFVVETDASSTALGPLRAEVLRMTHDASAAGHFGRYRMTHLVSLEFWWPHLKADVARYVASCDVCRWAKGPTERPPGLLQPLPVPPHPWHTVSLDFVVDLPPSRGCTCLLVFSDHFTKMVNCAPCPSVPKAKETTQLYLQHVFRLHGLPERVVSDRGVQFTSRFWRALHQTLGTEVCLSSTYHPQTDGQTERANAVLELYLRCYCSYQQDDWVDHLPLAEFAYNNAVNASTQQTPFQ